MVPSEAECVDEEELCQHTRERLPLGWTPSPAVPGKLGEAGSVLILTAAGMDDDELAEPSCGSD